MERNVSQNEALARTVAGVTLIGAGLLKRRWWRWPGSCRSGRS